MEIFNLLNVADIEIGLFGQTYDVYLNWIGKIIRFLIGSVGSVGVGIILFSLVLKLIVMPFDIYQRISMRKQNLKMKENQARMEKLQKQYANNKELYNQKVMEMYKESGISMFSSCLPMILSMVIFIVAINAFNAYSQYSNIENYNTMVEAYNGKMEYYCADLTEENLTLDGNVITVKDAAGEEKYIYYTVTVADGSAAGETKAEQIEYVKSHSNDRVFKINVEKAQTNAEIKEYVDAKIEELKANAGDVAITAEDIAETEKNAYKEYFTSKAQSAVVEVYNAKIGGRTKFLWIKNIWATDATYKHPVLEYSEFKTEISKEDFNVSGKKTSLNSVRQYTNVYTEDAYKLVTGKLDAQKDAANGYFILIALSIGTILLQQFISMRSQKEQQKYSSVDGQGASQQKMMMVIMTGMFAIFSFMYSSAFSIYMITSNLFSMLSTLVINKAVDTAEYKKEQKALKEQYERRNYKYKNNTTDADKGAKKDKKDKK